MGFLRMGQRYGHDLAKPLWIDSTGTITENARLENDISGVVAFFGREGAQVGLRMMDPVRIRAPTQWHSNPTALTGS